jgi:hypothetical protein
MGGILGNEAWRRSNGGLWLPRAFGMPETVYGWCCCGEPEAVYSCLGCISVIPQTLEVDCTFTGFGATTKCPNCPDLNDTFRLTWEEGVQSPYCQWQYQFDPSPCSSVDFLVLRFAANYTPGTYGWELAIQFEMDGHLYDSYVFKSLEVTNEWNCNAFEEHTFNLVFQEWTYPEGDWPGGPLCDPTDATCSLKSVVV